MKLIVGLFLVMVSGDPSFDSQIFQGNEAKDGQFSYHIGLRILFRLFDLYYYNCGGSLISDRFILTAAHCVHVYDIEDITAFLGSRHLLKGIERPGRRKIVHPGWADEHSQHNIALLEIDSVNYSDRIQSIKLPSFSDLDLSYEGHKAVVSGWGYTNSSQIESLILQYTHLLVTSNTVCDKAYGIDDFITEDFICAGDSDGSTYGHNDYGGPLVEVKSETLIGIVTFGPNVEYGFNHSVAAAFTRVTSYREWIYNHTGI